LDDLIETQDKETEEDSFVKVVQEYIYEYNYERAVEPATQIELFHQLMQQLRARVAEEIIMRNRLQTLHEAMVRQQEMNRENSAIKALQGAFQRILKSGTWTAVTTWRNGCREDIIAKVQEKLTASSFDNASMEEQVDHLKKMVGMLQEQVDKGDEILKAEIALLESKLQRTLESLTESERSGESKDDEIKNLKNTKHELELKIEEDVIAVQKYKWEVEDREGNLLRDISLKDEEITTLSDLFTNLQEKLNEAGLTQKEAIESNDQA